MGFMHMLKCISKRTVFSSDYCMQTICFLTVVIPEINRKNTTKPIVSTNGMVWHTLGEDCLYFT